MNTATHDPHPAEDLVCTTLEMALHLIVDEPDEVFVTARREEDATRFVVRASPSDVGKIVGRAGRNAGALRVLLAAASGKHRHRFTLSVEQPGRA